LLRLAQQQQLFLGRFAAALGTELDQRIDSSPFFWADVRQLLDFQVFVLFGFLVRLCFAKTGGNCFGPLAATFSATPASLRAAKTSLPIILVRVPMCPASAVSKASEVRHARFWLCDETRKRVASPTKALFGRPVSSRFRLEGG
jgi:hypothetical protein